MKHSGIIERYNRLIDGKRPSITERILAAQSLLRYVFDIEDSGTPEKYREQYISCYLEQETAYMKSQCYNFDVGYDILLAKILNQSFISLPQIGTLFFMINKHSEKHPDYPWNITTYSWHLMPAVVWSLCDDNIQNVPFSKILNEFLFILKYKHMQNKIKRQPMSMRRVSGEISGSMNNFCRKLADTLCNKETDEWIVSVKPIIATACLSSIIVSIIRCGGLPVKEAEKARYIAYLNKAIAVSGGK